MSDLAADAGRNPGRRSGTLPGRRAGGCPSRALDRASRRWERERRALVSSAATALIVALVGLGAITAVQTKARNDLSKKNTALNEADAQVTKANAARSLRHCNIGRRTPISPAFATTLS